MSDWACLKLRPYRQQSLQHRSNQKISPKYYSPYQVQAVIGQVAYKLKLLASAKIHDAFHVSQLKAFHVTLPMATNITSWFQGHDSGFVPTPAAILDREKLSLRIMLRLSSLCRRMLMLMILLGKLLMILKPSFQILIFLFRLEDSFFKGEEVLGINKE